VGLLPRAVDVVGRWRWLLVDEQSGAPLADHQVALDPGSAVAQAFAGLDRILRWQADPVRRAASEAALVERIGGWIGGQVLGTRIGRAIAAEAPVTVRPQVPERADFLSFAPLELAHGLRCVGGWQDRCLSGERVDPSCRPGLVPPPQSAFTGFRFPAEVIVVAVGWYLRYSLSYRDIEELLVERGAEVDHVSVFRRVQRFTPLLADAARFARHSPGNRWFVDEAYVKINGIWWYVYRAVDQYGQVIHVLVSAHRDAAAAGGSSPGRCRR
jgi:DDE domain